MIKISIKKENDKLKEIFIKGHANYDEYGKDIVCASCSSIVTTTINGIESIDKDAINYSDDKGVKIEILKQDDTTLKLIENMLDLLKELANDYPKTIEFL